MACVFVRERWRETTVVDELFVAVLACCTSVDRAFLSAWPSVVGGGRRELGSFGAVTLMRFHGFLRQF